MICRGRTDGLCLWETGSNGELQFPHGVRTCHQDEILNSNFVTQLNSNSTLLSKNRNISPLKKKKSLASANSAWSFKLLDFNSN